MQDCSNSSALAMELLQSGAKPLNDDITIWKHFLHYWPFVRGIQWSPVDSSYTGAVMQGLDVFIAVSQNMLWNKQLSCQWFEMP